MKNQIKNDYWIPGYERNKCFVFNLCEETISRTDEGQPRPKYIFSINVELTSTFLLYRGLVHHHHRILFEYRSSIILN